MLVKYSYSNKKLKRQVEELVGAPYSLLQRLRMNGNGSQRLSVISSNDEILNILETKSTSDPYINIELRPGGIIIHFRVRLDNWALIIPFHKLTIFSQDNLLNIYVDHWKLKLSGYRNTPIRMNFIFKIIEYKAEATATPIDQ